MAHAHALQALAYYDDLFPLVGKPLEARSLVDNIRAFTGFGTATEQFDDEEIPYFVNEFWTSGQRKGHAIHEVSYRACFKPQLPEFFIERVTQTGDFVLDPFMGRGTTPVQAALMGRVPCGNDINPLSVLLTRPRLNAPNLGAVAEALRAIDWSANARIRNDLLAFYHPDTLRQISVLRDHLLRHAPIDDASPDPALDWIRMIAINRLTGHSNGFFSVYSLPPNQAVSIGSQLKINAKRNQTPPQRDIPSLILKKTRSLLRDGAPKPTINSHLSCGAADAIKNLADGSVALTVTSPPFLDVVQYADDNWLRCWFAGIDVSHVAISMHKGELAWMDMVRRVLIDQARLLRPQGHIAFEVGEVRGGKILLERLVWKAAEGLPFKRLGVMVNQQEFTKTANCWGVKNNAKGTNSNRIVLLRKSSG